MLDSLVRRVALATVVASVIVVAATVGTLASPTLRNWVVPPAALAPAYAVGDAIDLGPDVYGHQPVTLVVFASVDCAASVKSGPAFEYLARSLRSDRIRVVLVTGLQGQLRQEAYAREIGFLAVDHYRADLAPLKVRVVPSVAVVDRRGRVRLTREGPMTVQDATAIVRLVGELPAGPA